jgi:hypothetical protein
MRSPVSLPLLLALVMPLPAGAGQPVSSQPPIFQSATIPQPVASAAGSVQALTPGSGSPHPAFISPARLVPAVSQTTGRQGTAADPAALCETAVTAAESVNRLPPHLLGAISVTETGRVQRTSGRIRPWPWTINAQGEGEFFATLQDAVLAVRALQLRGVRSIDVGCLQVNLLFHPNAFASLEEAFDPRSNANFAAQFLNALFADGKDWPAAIAAYHSETPALGDAYRVLVMAHWHDGRAQAFGVGHAPYGDFAPAGKAYDERAYGAFAPGSRVYGAFAPR